MHPLSTVTPRRTQRTPIRTPHSPSHSSHVTAHKPDRRHGTVLRKTRGKRGRAGAIECEGAERGATKAARGSVTESWTRGACRQASNEGGVRAWREGGSIRAGKPGTCSWRP
eukprot:746653-Rhodomonas_salina.3